MSEFESRFSQPTEIGTIPNASQLVLKDLGQYSLLEVRTDKGGFTFRTLPWKSGQPLEGDSEVLASRLNYLGDLEEPMDGAEWFIIGGAEVSDEEADLGLIERGKPILYRPVKLMGVTQAIEENIIASDEGLDYLRESGLTKRVHGVEVYLQADELCATGIVRQVSLLKGDRTEGTGRNSIRLV